MPIQYQIYYWRDIPAQVRVRHGSQRAACSLDLRFQEAIDEAAMQTRATSTDDYLEDWRTSDWQEEAGDPDPENFARDLVDKIEKEYPPARLEEFKKNKGYQPG